jgi:hypothetical protein
MLSIINSEFMSDYLKLEEIFESLEIPMDILSEVTDEQKRTLEKIDDSFFLLKKYIDSPNGKIKDVKKDLVKSIREFTGIRQIELNLSSETNLNAGVIAVYNKVLSIKIIEMNRDWPEDLSEFARKYISGMYIYLSTDLIKYLHERELTAVLLHEFGHVFGHTKAMSYILPDVIAKIINVLNFLGVSSILLNGLLVAMQPLLVTFWIPISFLLTRSVEFLNHREEYGADNFATHYGYGGSLIKVLERFNKVSKSKKKGILNSIFYRILILLSQLLTPSTHPDDSKRVCRIYNDIVNDYVELYPVLGKDVLKIVKQFECEPSEISKRMIVVDSKKKIDTKSIFSKIFTIMTKVLIRKRDKK